MLFPWQETLLCPRPSPQRPSFQEAFQKHYQLAALWAFGMDHMKKLGAITARHHYTEGMLSASLPLPKKSAGAAGSQHDNKRESISSTIPPNPSKSPSPGAPLGDFQSICSLAGMLLGPTSKIYSSLRAMALPQDAFQRQEESSKEVLRKVIYVL